MTERKKIIDILNKNFTQEVECTPVYTTADGKEIELPQELCDIFNDIVTQAVIPYFADALIAAGIGDVGETKEKLKKINERILLGDIIACDLSAKCAEYKYRAEVAERALDKACEDIEQLMDCCRWAADGGVITIKEYTPEKATPQAYIDRTKKEIAEERKGVGND